MLLIREWINSGKPLNENGLPQNPAPQISSQVMAASAQDKTLTLPTISDLTVILDGDLTCQADDVFVSGQAIQITGSGFLPGAQVQVILDTGPADPIELVNVVADVDGNLDTFATIPENISNDPLAAIQAHGTGASGEPRLLIAWVGIAQSSTEDTDNDGTPDFCDTCPNTPSGSQEDADADGIGDVCDVCPNDPWNDADEDTLCSDEDACPLDPDNDIDGDGFCAESDNCPTVYNPDQADGDNDGVGDVCANNPPIAQCMAVTLECAAGQTEDVSVDNGSYDPDGDLISLTQYPAPPYNLFPPGTVSVELTAADEGESAVCTGTIIVDDTAPPEISLSVLPETLWPPNHRMVPITITVMANDACDPNPGIALKSITMNEGDETNTYDPNYDDTIGDGNTTDDIQLDGDGNISLRAERSGTGTGRVYTIRYEATDASGNSATAEATVTVPHNQ